MTLTLKIPVIVEMKCCRKASPEVDLSMTRQKNMVVRTPHDGIFSPLINATL